MAEKLLHEIYLGRQPILDRSKQLYAYELLFRESSELSENYATFIDGNQASAAVIVNTFTEFSLADALGPYRGVIKMDHGLLFSELIKALPPNSVIFEIQDNEVISPETIARCEHLKELGYSFIVRERAESLDHNRPLVQLAEIIKLDTSRTNPVRIKQMVSKLKLIGKTLLAEKVETPEQAHECEILGFDLFQGYFFSKPAIIRGKCLRPTEVLLLRLLGLLTKDGEDNEIEAVFKQEPGLTVNLLRLTNSASSGLSVKITSLRHAIQILGRRQLTRWLQLLLYTGGTGQTQTVNPLLQLAAVRGRMMELLVERSVDVGDNKREYIDQAYMVGILSLLPTLMSVEMEEITSRLPLSPLVADALLHRIGLFGELLELIELLEDASLLDNEEAVVRATENLARIDIAYANKCLVSAIKWSSDLAREMG